MKVLQGAYQTTGTSPNVQAANASGPTATDGTQLDAAWLTDVFGVFQYALDAVGDSPDGSNELVSNATATNSLDGSQVLTALQGISGGAGELALLLTAKGASIPSSKRLLELTGQLVAVADYPDLAAAVWCGSTYNATATSLYRTNSGDTVRSDSGTHLRLPNAQGLFLRGADTGATYDPDGATRLPGSIQETAVGEHNHADLYTGVNETGTGYKLNVTGDPGTGIATTTAGVDTFYTGNAVQAAAGSTPEIETTESRPANLQVRICVRY